MPSGSESTIWLLLAIEIGAFALAFYLGCRAVEPLAREWKLWDPPSGRKDHERPVLFTGGLLFLASFLAAAGFLLTSQDASGDLALVVAGALLCAFAGFMDDFLKSRGRDLAARWKLLAQVGSGALAVAGGIQLRLFGDEAVNAAATLLWLVAVQNAWNFLDNMDGLAGGLAAIAALSFAAIFASLGAADLALVAGALAGACLGFLPRNYPRAKAFLGDAGTGCLGFAFGALSVAGTYVTADGPGLVAITVPVAVLAIPLFDMVQVVVARLLARKPIYRGDHRHLSHRMAEKLGSRVTAVATLFGTGLLLGGLSLLVPHVSLGAAYGILAAQAAAFLGLLFFALR